MTSYKTKAIIINRLNLGESDRILTLFSPEFGKIRAICKGSRRTKSKFGGHTELFSCADFVVSKGKSLDIITDAVLSKNYLNTDPDIDKVQTAYFFAEVLNKLLPDETPNKEVYNLYQYCLEKINTFDSKFIQLLFVAKLLKDLGIYPELSTCVVCSEKPDRAEIFFSQGAGGITDRKCSTHFEDSVETNESVVKLWRFLADSSFERIEKLSADKAIVCAASDLAVQYICRTTMIDAKSLRVLS